MAEKGGRKENLKPFKKGHDDRRNLNGAPKRLPELKDLVDDLFGSEDGEVSKARIRKVLEQQFKKAEKGDSRAAEIILGYSYGKPRQAHEHSGEGGGPLEVKQWVIKVKEVPEELKYNPDNTSM